MGAAAVTGVAALLMSAWRVFDPGRQGRERAVNDGRARS
jgi:hypothetical protein